MLEDVFLQGTPPQRTGAIFQVGRLFDKEPHGVVGQLKLKFSLANF